jgi:hypothetical protein
MSATKVFIMSVPRETAVGLENWTSGVSGKKLKKTKVGETVDRVSALYDRKIGGLATGLTEPWIDEEGNQVKDENNKPLTLQQKYEQRWGLEPGFLTNRPWRKGDSMKEEDMTYFQRMYWKVNDGTTVIDMSVMDDVMFYHVALASKYFANSEKELRSHKWPRAKWYIALENESDEIKYKRNERKSKAFAALHSAEMTEEMKRKFIYLLELASSKVSLTAEQTHNLLFDYLNNTTFTPGSNLSKFMSLYSKLGTADGREELEAMYLLKQAVDNRIIYEKQGAYVWVRSDGKLELGQTKTEAVEFILNPKKQSLVEELETLLTEKKNS